MFNQYTRSEPIALSPKSYSQQASVFDPTESSPPNTFIQDLTQRMNIYFNAPVPRNSGSSNSAKAYKAINWLQK